MKLITIAFSDTGEPIAWLYAQAKQRIDTDGQLVPLDIIDSRRRRRMAENTGVDNQAVARGIQKQMDYECHRKAIDRGETTFTLVERDPTAARTILFWIMENFDGKTPALKLRDAFDDALSMLFSPIGKRRAD